MARPIPIPEQEAPPKEYAPAYFIMVAPETYKSLSDAAAKRNMTLARLVSNALSEYLKKIEGD